MCRAVGHRPLEVGSYRRAGGEKDDKNVARPKSNRLEVQSFFLSITNPRMPRYY